MTGALYVVATPIGNLEDITLRAITTLQNVDLILAEDTRTTKVLLDRYNIKKEVISYHQHSGLTKIDRIVKLLEGGKKVALVSDAGTPGINDPGQFLISKIRESIPEIKVVGIPGANAALTAISISGFSSDEFLYLGFPPHKKGRQTFFRKLSQIKTTAVFYESKHRILKTLDALIKISELGNREIMVARELTKQFETIYRGSVQGVLAQLPKEILGEFVIVVSPGKIKSKNE